MDLDTDEESQCAVMAEGSYFGELSLLMGTRRSTSARAIDHSNVFVLTKVRDVRHTNRVFRFVPSFPRICLFWMFSRPVGDLALVWGTARSKTHPDQAWLASAVVQPWFCV